MKKRDLRDLSSFFFSFFSKEEIICPKRKEKEEKNVSRMGSLAKDNRRRQRNNITAGTGDKAGVTWRGKGGGPR